MSQKTNPCVTSLVLVGFLEHLTCISTIFIHS